MGSKTGISWTDATWNPWQGCTKVSDGCKNCYMYREKTRYGQDPFKVVRSAPATFNAPLKWARTGKLPEGSRIFVCSWSDFFHKDADAWRDEAWEIMTQLPYYKFLIPTKRPERILPNLPNFWFAPRDVGGGYLGNIWLGVSVENQKTADERIPILMKVPAAVHWLSLEPLLGPVDLRHIHGDHVMFDILGGSRFDFGDDGFGVAAPMMFRIDWTVVGGESGPNFRSMELGWAKDIVMDCKHKSIPVFVKQLGGWPDTRHELEDFPEDLRVREFPR
jgi:protein gp37